MSIIPEPRETLPPANSVTGVLKPTVSALSRTSAEGDMRHDAVTVESSTIE